MIYKVTTKTNFYYIVADSKDEAIMEISLRTPNKDDVIGFESVEVNDGRYMLGCVFLVGIIFFYLILIFYWNN